MADTDWVLRAVLTRLDALERDIVSLRADNLSLKDDIQRLRSPVAINDGAASPVPSSSTTASAMEPITRRRVLRRAVQASAAVVAAGVVLQTQTHEATANHVGTNLDVNWVYAHSVVVTHEDHYSAIWGQTTSPSAAAVAGIQNGSAAGVYGQSGGGDGVQGFSYWTDASGVYGGNLDQGFGVTGDTTSAGTTDIDLTRAGVYGRNNGTGAGVLGRSVNDTGDGVFGRGKVGVHGTSLNGHGVFGEGGSGYGGQFKGTRAQVRLTPTGRTGKPATGVHQVGELYLDKVGSLFICTAAGTPGTWKKVTVS